MQYTISGYLGTDSMPVCTDRLCWYLINQPFTITQAEFDFFNVEGQASNARNPNQYDTATHTTQQFYNNGPFATYVAQPLET